MEEKRPMPKLLPVRLFEMLPLPALSEAEEATSEYARIFARKGTNGDIGPDSEK